MIYWPTSPQSAADFLGMLPNGSVCKVQVKTATRCVVGKSVFHQVRLGGCGRPEYSPLTVSHFAILMGTRLSVIPYHELAGKASFSIGARSANRRLFERYEWV